MNELEVCVVDDDQYYNSLVKAVVEQKAQQYNEKVEVHSFASGLECLQNGYRPDLVFLDFYLSTSNDITQTGLDVLKKIKEQNPDTIVVFMSQVHDWEQFKEELIEEGATDFIKKDDNLPEHIDKILQRTLKNYS